MTSPLGIRAPRLSAVRALRTVKGRREQRRFAFEGATLLAEAHAAGAPVEELYVTQAAYEASPLVRELKAAGTPVFIVAPASAEQISDLESPPGILAVGPIRLAGLDELFAAGPLVLVLADVADPANAGTLLRSADAFGCRAVVFGSLGVDPYHPKVVRGSMGAIFRLTLAVADPAETAAAAARAGLGLLGLTAGGGPLEARLGERPQALVVGHERHGLGRWTACCEAFAAIPMRGPAESLSAAVAGSIALYEASRSSICQESTPSPKSQDYRVQN